MKIPKQCKIEKAVSKDKCREAMMNVLIDTKDTQAKAIATNGKILAIVPIETDATDKLGGERLINKKTIIEARKQGGIISLNGAAVLQNGEVYPVRDDLNFPNWRKVIPDEQKETYTSVRFDAKLLFELAQAIGAENHVVTLRIPGTPRQPLVIDEPKTGGKGILMPVRM